VDEDGNIIDDSGNESEDNSEVVYSESFFQPEIILKMSEKLFGFPCTI